MLVDLWPWQTKNDKDGCNNAAVNNSDVEDNDVYNDHGLLIVMMIDNDYDADLNDDNNILWSTLL